MAIYIFTLYTILQLIVFNFLFIKKYKKISIKIAIVGIIILFAEFLIFYNTKKKDIAIGRMYFKVYFEIFFIVRHS